MLIVLESRNDIVESIVVNCGHIYIYMYVFLFLCSEADAPPVVESCPIVCVPRLSDASPMLLGSTTPCHVTPPLHVVTGRS